MLQFDDLGGFDERLRTDVATATLGQHADARGERHAGGLLRRRDQLLRGLPAAGLARALGHEHVRVRIEFENQIENRDFRKRKLMILKSKQT